VEAGIVAHHFAVDPVAVLADSPTRQMIRVAAYMASARAIQKAQDRRG